MRLDLDNSDLLFEEYFLVVVLYSNHFLVALYESSTYIDPALKRLQSCSHVFFDDICKAPIVQFDIAIFSCVISSRYRNFWLPFLLFIILVSSILFFFQFTQKIVQYQSMNTMLFSIFITPQMVKIGTGVD